MRGICLITLKEYNIVLLIIFKTLIFIVAFSLQLYYYNTKHYISEKSKRSVRVKKLSYHKKSQCLREQYQSVSVKEF